MEEEELCSRCKQIEATEEWNNKPVCEECFDELDAGEEEELTEEEIKEFSSGEGVNLFNLTTGLIYFSVMLLIGAMLLQVVSDAQVNQSNVTSALEGSTRLVETLSHTLGISPSMGMFILLLVVSITFFLIWRVMNPPVATL